MANVGYGFLPLLTGNANVSASGADTLPLLVGSARAALKAANVLPLLVSSGQGESPSSIGIDVLPLLTSSGYGLTGEIGHGKGILPLLVSSGHIYPVVKGTGVGNLFLLISTGHGLSGVIGQGDGVFPLLISGGSAILPAHGVGAGILPLLYSVGHGDVIPVTFNRKAIVMHLFNYAVTEYKNYNFNSLLHFNGVFLGVNEQGVYILDGDDDLGELIQARIKTGVTDLAKDGVMTIPREVWLAYRSDDGMQLDVRVNEVTDLPPMIFEKVARMIRENRKKFGRGIKGRFFTWDLKNISGSDFDFQSLRILGDIIKRKTR
jgi:hypothetical protein